MSSSSNRLPVRTWCWRRWITAGREEMWLARLGPLAGLGCTVTERANRTRLLLEVYQSNRMATLELARRFGGVVRAIDPRDWLVANSAPTRIGRHFEIVHEKRSSDDSTIVRRLFIPHGMAFGSGDHPTTHLLLRALMTRCDADWSRSSVLDLGTGSGVLALAARLLGARKIAANDFDSDAVRIARENEGWNFRAATIAWSCADVRRLRARTKYDLVLANLFSGILIEAAARIAGSVAAKGDLWLSGILRVQQEEVAEAYRGEGFQLVRAVRRGKWVMLQLRKIPS